MWHDILHYNVTCLQWLVFPGGSEKLLRVCLNLPYFLRYINRFQDAVSANSFFIMPATVADATAVRNGYVFTFLCEMKWSEGVIFCHIVFRFYYFFDWKWTPFAQVSFTGDRRNHGFGHTFPACAGALDTGEITGYDRTGFELSLCWWVITLCEIKLFRRYSLQHTRTVDVTAIIVSFSVVVCIPWEVKEKKTKTFLTV